MQYLSLFFIYRWGYVCDQMRSPGTLLTIGQVVCRNLNSSYPHGLTSIRQRYSVFDSGECAYQIKRIYWFSGAPCTWGGLYFLHNFVGDLQSSTVLKKQSSSLTIMEICDLRSSISCEKIEFFTSSFFNIEWNNIFIYVFKLKLPSSNLAENPQGAPFLSNQVFSIDNLNIRIVTTALYNRKGNYACKFHSWRILLIKPIYSRLTL